MAQPFKIFIMPHPRRLSDIFSTEALDSLRSHGTLIIHEEDQLSEEDFSRLAMDSHVMMGTFDMPAERLSRCRNLKAFINSEGNFLPNIDYEFCFKNGIRVISASHVFAEPVAEIGLAMAIDLGRGITRSDRLMRSRNESYGFDANRQARQLFRASVGLIGFGDLAHALLPLLRPFNVSIKVYDPWIPETIIRKAGCEPASLDDTLAGSTFVFVLAGVTSENLHFIDQTKFSLMKPGSIFLLLSRAAVVDFPAMIKAARSGHIHVATDVFPVEPVAANDPIRDVEEMILSPHQAGALDEVLKEMGTAIAADIGLIAKGLPPIVCKIAQPETAARARSMPVAKS
jgi:phosphoglycerate dehydrogenase-like enzyme